MSVNLISIIMQSLSPDTIRKIAFALGTDHTSAQQAIGAAVPGLLGSLANAAASPEGALKVNSAVREADANSVSNFIHRISESPQNMMEAGSSLMSNLLGRNAAHTLGSIVAQCSGLGLGSATRLLGFIAPLVLGVLRKEQISSGLDAKGLAKLLESQRGNIKAALPAGVFQQLQENRPVEASAPAAQTQRTAGRYGSSQESRNWLYWLIPALAVVALAFYLIPRAENPQENRAITENAKPNPAPPPQGVTAQNTQAQPTPVTATTGVGNDVMSNVDRLRASLQTIKDGPSAQAALPELRTIADNFSKLKAGVQQLPPEQHKTLIANINARMPDLNTLFERVSTQQNAAETKPAIDTLKSQLDGMLKT